ncbi:HPP family protein [Sporomusa acidovorans]|uniref:HPP transmembrane region domain-containing protein n=1 Tax=Sporomusa acidovorans (strain ATCC 49682 / DSM 3132 / Mol) TaxID=1123286 RepID=A0ABZ3J0I6_SPOA4|nr:HPP family protein [Sporomusa acidovorans]OZC17317.1 HPP family protein [Sporomusa acidovorans DSM 3132]SDF85620.1 HPP family protein [Sporomusa acidovorans]
MPENVSGKTAKTEWTVHNELIVLSCQEYLQKLKTIRRCDVARPPISECFWALVGSFVGIGVVTYLSFIQGIPVVVASLGASACLIYGVPAAPFAQPRNAIAGHLLSAVVGVCVYQLAGAYWYTAAFSVGLAVAIMVGTRTVHPPAGATALIAVLTQQNWLFVLLPVGVGIGILVCIGLIVNNLAVKRKYPTYWW